VNKRKYLLIGGIVVVAVVVSALLYHMLGNQRPVITGLQAEPQLVAPLGSCQISCAATDPDGDKLSYSWTSSGGAITGQGATVTWTAPGSSGSYNVAVEVTDGHGGKVTDQISITVRDNHPPVITSLIPSANWTTPSGAISLNCTAVDADQDQLSYEWAADGGYISGSGPAVNWTAPQTVGAYNITVVVKDGYGGEATGKVILSVNLGTPPTIESLTVTPRGNPYLREDGVAGCDYEVYQTEQYDIDCAASGTGGELVYDWSCTGGEISGQGSTVTWTAPNTSTSFEVTVTVAVSYASGNGVSQSIVLYVSDCTCVF
jgi:hypothetical protein